MDLVHASGDFDRRLREKLTLEISGNTMMFWQICYEVRRRIHDQTTLQFAKIQQLNRVS
jgi:hypothetical protein